MKIKPLLHLLGLATVALSSVTSAYAQGFIVFNNNVAGVVRAPVYGQEGDPTLAKCGNTSTGIPAGTQTYTGALLAGTGFTAQLWAGPLGTADSSLTLAATTTFRTGGGAGFIVAPTSAVAIASVPAGNLATVQFRVWDNQGGAVTTWAAVLADPTVARGACVSVTDGPLTANSSSAPNLTNIVSFNIRLVGCPTPTITCPTPLTNSTCSSNLVVNYAAPAVANGALAGCVPASGGAFPLGTNSVTCTATNACGTNNCMFNVVVSQTAVVSITCPASFGTNICGASAPINFRSNPTVSNGGLRSCVPTNGSVLNLGLTVVTCTATNLCGTNSCSFNITVGQLTAAALTCPGNYTTNVCGSSTPVNYPNPTVTVGVLQGCVPTNGAVFSLGTTSVACTATNRCSTNSCVFNVTVQQIAAPTITCPANITTNITGGSVAVSYANPTVAAGALQSCTPPSGSTFALGTNFVICMATNACAATTCTFYVTVMPFPQFQTNLIATGSTWRYLADGSDAGTAWRTAGFDDSSWSNGVAKLGFGGDGEATVIGNMTNHFVTFYFRHHFNVATAAAITNLFGRMMRDDGAVVYINGLEAYRSNLPTNAINHLTLASTTVNAPEETSFFTNAISPSLLVNGDNVLAIEVHQADPNSSDLGMEFELLANANIVLPVLNVAITNLPSTTNLLVGDNLPINATVSGPSGIDRVDFFVNGGILFSDLTSPYAVTLPDVTVGTHLVTAVAVETGGKSITSAPVTVIVTNRPEVTVLVPNGASWCYLDNGSDQGTAWRQLGFNASSWSNGLAELGYGDLSETPPRPERTVVGFGPDSTNKFITTYFRHSFNVSATQNLAVLTLRLLRDDGAVAYLNGAEVARQNMPGGAIGYQTRATSNINGTNEATYFATDISASRSLLQVGNNLLAVEVHQDTNSTSDLSIDLMLEAAFTNAPPMVSIASPTNGQVFIPGANVAVNVSASDTDTGVARVDFYVDGQARGLDTSAPYDFALGNIGLGAHTLLAVAVDNGGLSTTSAPVTISVPFEPGTVTLVANRSCWRYWDQGTDLGAGWMLSGYDDSGWPMGFGEFGYGDGDETTVVGFGPNPANKSITTYFRSTFSVPDTTAYSNLILRLKRDDGAVVYLNGVEVFRDNLPGGSINYLTLASIAAPDDGAGYLVTNISSSLLIGEQNVLAVEIHQNATNSTDISFDLQLIGQVGVLPPALRIRMADPTHVLLTWPSSTKTNFALQSKTLLTSGIWIDNASLASEVGNEWQVLEPIGPATRFYRLCATSVDTNACQPPVIVSMSSGTNLPAGSDLTLAVSVFGSAPVFYQWRKNERPIPGANAPTLSLANLQRADGGSYDVSVGNDCLCYESCPITVIVGGNGPAPTNSFGARPVLTGVTGEINGSLSAATVEPAEPFHPTANGTNTVWLGWTAPTNGMVALDTAGSGLRIAVTVYRGTALTNLVIEATLGPNEADGTTRTRFYAEQGVTYAWVFTGVGLSPSLCVNFALSPGSLRAPTLVQTPRRQFAAVGTTACFTNVATLGSTATNNTFSYQYYFNGVPISGATNSVYCRTITGPQDTGMIYALATNTSGSATSPPAGLIPFDFSQSPGWINPPRGDFNSSGSCGVFFNKKQFFCFRMSDTPPVATCDSSSDNRLLPEPSSIGSGKHSLRARTFYAVGNVYTNSDLDTAIVLSRAATEDYKLNCVGSATCKNNNLACTTARCFKLSDTTLTFGTCNVNQAWMKATVYFNAITANYTGSSCLTCLPGDNLNPSGVMVWIEYKQ